MTILTRAINSNPFPPLPSVLSINYSGINGFDFESASVSGVDVSVNQATSTKTNFQIDLNSNSTWKSIKINFLSTTRPDLELGSASLAAPSNSDTFTIDYKFKNKWSSADFLRYKVFISGFSLRTNEQNNVRVNL